MIVLRRHEGAGEVNPQRVLDHWSTDLEKPFWVPAMPG